jgi:tetratricopeptide (TPR) repeat protein
MNRKQRRAAESQTSPLDALYAQASAHQQAGRTAEALAAFRQATILAPRNPETFYNYGVASTQWGTPADALAAFQTATTLKPDFAAAHANLGTALLAAGRLADAVSHLATAARLDPANPTIHNNYGAALKKSGRPADAAAAYRTALALAPTHIDALTNLAAVLSDLGDHAAAGAIAERAIATAPAHAAAHNVAGVIALDTGDPHTAIAAFRAAISLAPGNPDAYVNLGDALAAIGEPDAPLHCCKAAAARAPNNPDALNNLGTALFHARQIPDAIATFQHALALAPDRAETHFHLGMALLAAGDMPAGWHEYEFRWQTPMLAPARRIFAGATLWDGAPAPDKTLLLHAEQGFGDTIQFCRYAPLAAAHVGRLTVEVQAPLTRLLQTSFPDLNIVARGTPLPPSNIHAPLLSLPAIFNTSLATIPAKTSYLHADPAETARFASRLTNTPGLRIGLCWSGNSYRTLSREMATIDRRRSLDPALLAPLTTIPGLHLISLQKDATAPFPLTDLMADCPDFAATAALIANLDLIISVDTAVAHLAAALGKPTWLLNRYDCEWRWLHDRTDSPWYPSLKLYPQPAPGAWPAVIAQIMQDLTNQL